MAYKKYIKRKGKVYGPYIYHSKKVKGKVISEYLGKDEEKNNKKRKQILIFLITILVIFSLIIGLNYNKIDFNNAINITKSTINNIITPITKSLTGFAISGDSENESSPILNKTILENITESNITINNISFNKTIKPTKTKEVKFVTNFFDVSGNLIYENDTAIVYENDTNEGVFVGGNSSWENYILQGKIIILNGSGGAGLIFRFVDNGNYYLVYLDWSDQEFGLWKKEGGKWSLLKSVNYLHNYDVEYTLKVEAYQDNFDCFMDDIHQFTIQDSEFSSGKVGIYTSIQNAQFANIKVNVYQEVENEKGGGK